MVDFIGINWSGRQDLNLIYSNIRQCHTSKNNRLVVFSCIELCKMAQEMTHGESHEG